MNLRTVSFVEKNRLKLYYSGLHGAKNGRKAQNNPPKGLALQFSHFQLVDPFLKKQCVNSSKGSLKGKKEKANSYMLFNGLHICIASFKTHTPNVSQIRKH